MTAGLPKSLNSLWERLPKGFFVLKFFLSVCGLVIKKYMGGGDKKKKYFKNNFNKFRLFYRGGKR
jgi:hypothetical protein